MDQGEIIKRKKIQKIAREVETECREATFKSSLIFFSSS